MRGLEWVERLPVDIAEIWSELKIDLVLHKFEISRPVVITQIKHIQLHIFSDASEKAFAAAIYSRTPDSLATHQ